jgi:hypothetical protein
VEARGFSRGGKGPRKPALAAVAIYPQRLKAFSIEHCFPCLKAWASTTHDGGKMPFQSAIKNLKS